MPGEIGDGAMMARAPDAGLWCPDGQRGEFERGDDPGKPPPCRRCGLPAMDHWTRRPEVLP